MTGSPNQVTVSAISNKIIQFISDYCEIRSLKNDDISFNASSGFLLEEYLDKNLIQLLVGFISKIAGGLIKKKKNQESNPDDKEEKKESEEERVNRHLLESKLLSGGIENWFLKIFSKENWKALEEIVDVTGDDQIKDFLKSEETIDEDKILDEIIHNGKNPEVDRIVDLL